MQAQRHQKISFSANIIHEYGAKKSMIANISQYWPTINTQPDRSIEKVYALDLMSDKPFNPKIFYENLIKRFKRDTQDFDFTIIIKKNKDKPKSIELKTSDGQHYTAVECRNFPLWIVAGDLFRGEDVLITKVASLLSYNERGSQIQRAFDIFLSSAIQKARRRGLD